MQAPFTIFVCEFITGGGLCGGLISPSLLAEGRLMRDALLHDLQALPWRVLTTFDVRIPCSPLADEAIAVSAESDVWLIWEQCIQRADYVWLVAPETEGALYRLTLMAERHNKPVIGASSEAVALTSSKYQTYLHFQAHGISTVSTWDYSQWLLCAPKQFAEHGWLVKPDDGAGCNETYVFATANALSQYFQDVPRLQKTHVIQPYVQGIAASISIASDGRHAHVLSYNLQHMQRDGVRLVYAGGELNGAIEYRLELNRVAQKIQASLPALVGYYGVDVLLHPKTQEHTQVTVIEINPRLTTTYAMLAKTMHHNPAKLILTFILQPHQAWPNLTYERVDFEVQHAK